MTGIAELTWTILPLQLFNSRLIEVLEEKTTAMIFSNIEDILLTNTVSD